MRRSPVNAGPSWDLLELRPDLAEVRDGWEREARRLDGHVVHPRNALRSQLLATRIPNVKVAASPEPELEGWLRLSITA